MTKNHINAIIISIENLIISFLLFRVVEVQRTYEATATPETEGANLSEYSNNKRIDVV